MSRFRFTGVIWLRVKMILLLHQQHSSCFQHSCFRFARLPVIEMLHWLCGAIWWKSLERLWRSSIKLVSSRFYQISIKSYPNHSDQWPYLLFQALASCPVIDNEEREALADPSYQPISLDWRRHLLSAEQTKVASHLCNQILAEDPNSSLIPDIIGKNDYEFGLTW